jgi:uncharacterized glyoxalase superfamily protein PhnB
MAKKTKRQTKARSKSSAKARPRAKATRKPVAARAKGLQSLAPGLTANDAAASMKWYCDVLGFKVQERWEHEGTFLGGSMAQGGVTINISQDDWKLGRDRKKGQGVRLYITTADDIDTYARAVSSRGAILDHEPKDDWGYRAFSLADPDGYKITFMRPLE